MKTPIYEVATDHILINQNVVNSINLDEYVIGIQIRIFSDSPQDLLYGLNTGPTIPLTKNDLPASYGGFHVNGFPAIYTGTLNINWNNNVAGKGVVVITRLKPFASSQIEFTEDKFTEDTCID